MTMAGSLFQADRSIRARRIIGPVFA